MPARCELLDPADPAPPAWGRFIAEQRLTLAWDAGALAALAPRHPSLLLGLVHQDGRTVAAFCGRPRGPVTLPSVFECKLPPMGSTPGFAFAGELDRAGRRAAVAAFERALFRRLGWRCLGIAYRQVADDDLSTCGGLGRLRVATAPTTVLENRWGSLEEYLAALPLPGKRRRRLRWLQRSLAADPDLEIAIGGEVDAQAASRLAFLTELRHRRGRLDAPAQPVPPAYFDALAGGDGVVYLSYRDRAGRLLAFALAFDDGRRLEATAWGALHPRQGGRSDLLLDHHLRLIDLAIERERVAVGFGKPMTDVKRMLGCAPVPQSMVAAVPGTPLRRRGG